MEDTQGEANCFTEAEKALNISLPSCLKNVLIINGFNSSHLLAEISDDDILQIENFTADTVPTLIANEDYAKYFGIFSRKPENFKIIQGHRKLIKLISNYFQEQFRQSETLNRFSGTDANSPTSQGVCGSRSLLPDLGLHLSQETAHISAAVRNWLKSKCTGTDQWYFFKEKFNEISFETKYGTRNELCCIMKCYCKSEYKILKSAKKTTLTERWIYGNIYKHLAVHLNSYPGSMPTYTSSLRIHSPRTFRASIFEG